MSWTQSNLREEEAKKIVRLYHDQFGEEIEYYKFLPSDGARKEDILNKA